MISKYNTNLRLLYKGIFDTIFHKIETSSIILIPVLEIDGQRYENFKDAISQYEETYELFNEKADELAEKYREISEKTLEKIQYKVELKLDFNELERQFIEVEQTLLGDGWEKFSEAVWLAN